MEEADRQPQELSQQQQQQQQSREQLINAGQQQYCAQQPQQPQQSHPPQQLHPQQQQQQQQQQSQQPQQHQPQQQQQNFQPLMTKSAVQLLPPSSHGGSTGTDSYLHQTLIHRSGHCYQLHRPHLTLPVAVQPAANQPPNELELKPEHYPINEHHLHNHHSGHHYHHPHNHHQQQPMLAAPVSLDSYMPPSHHLPHQQQQQQQQQPQQQQQQHHIQRQHDTGQHQLGPAGIRHLVDNLSRNVVHKRAKTSSSSSSSSSSSQHRSQTSQNQRVHISCLYPEILAMIFSKLSVRDRGRAAQVCHSWREASFHRSAWKDVEAKLHLRKHSTPVFNCLEKRGIKHVQVLSLTMRRGLGDVFRCLSKLQSLSLSGCYNMSDSSLNSALNQKYPFLTDLNLSLCKNITDASLDMIAHCLVNLEVLEIGGCGNITNAGLHVIAWGLKKLKKLDLRSCWHITDLGISYLAGLNDDNGLGTFALEHLGLQDCQRLSDEALKHISVGLSKSLKSINLSFCVLVTDSGMKHLAKITSLRELNLRSCDNITEIGMAYLAEGGSRVTSLDVSFCDKIGDLALQNISQGLFHLRSLSLSACPISDEGIKMIAKTQHELETLHIGQCSRLTDRGVFVIVENMPKLRAIDLYGCIHISKEGIKMICDLPLVSLNLGLWQEKR